MPFWKKEKKAAAAVAGAALENGGVSNGTTTSNGSNSSAEGVGNGVGSSSNGNGGAWVKDLKVNYKARLEHKQYLAQESPEPVFDLSECALKNVPSGVYSRCKVSRKEGLLLQCNELTSLSGGGSLSDAAGSLQVLDLRCNQFEKLPEEVGSLKGLKVLYLRHNKLKKLPDALGDLGNLQSLDLSHNNLKDLPAALGRLTKVRTLNLSHNPKLTRLVKQIGQMRSLSELLLDGLSLSYPDAKVCQDGTEAIMKFLCKECDIEHISPSEYQSSSKNEDDNASKSVPTSNGYEDPYEKLVRGNLERLEKEKEVKTKSLLAMERAREEGAAKEALLTASMANNKQKLLTDLAQEEAAREEQVRGLQQLKDREREGLFESLAQDESTTDTLINELMAANARQKDPAKVLEDMERERKEMEERFTIKAGEEEKLREQEVLKEMQRVMQEELYREHVRRQYEQGKSDIVNTALTEGLANDAALDSILDSKGKHQQDLISDLLADEKYQREAFTAMYVKEDQKHKEICTQVEHIQAELANLTVIEMTKKDLKVDFECNVMDEKRETLTKMLMQLMDQKVERSKELQDRLQEMDEHRSQEQDNYWLIQYQKLLDAKPKGLLEAERAIDAKVKEVLEAAGAEEYVPVFALKAVTVSQLAAMSDKDLLEMGVHNTYLRQKILLCTEEVAQMEARLAKKLADIEGGGDGDRSAAAAAAPSAPPASLDPSAASAPPMEKGKEFEETAPPSAPPSSAAEAAGPSAPVVETFKSTECVVCMENKCDMIFLPCGHVCCCFNCGTSISACPLCRAAVAQKVRLH